VRDWQAERPWVSRFRDIGPGGYEVQQEVRTLHVGDVHIADTPPGYRVEGYADQILAKLDFIAQEAEARTVDLVMFVGDIFHHKRRVSHRLITQVADVMAQTKATKLILPGNHDMLENRLASVHEQPIGILGRMKDWSVLMGGSYTIGGLTIHPRPYVSGMGYDALEIHPTHIRPGHETRWQLLWMHYGVTPTTNPYAGLVTSDERFVTDADVVFTGHVHDNYGAWKAQDGTLCFNLGAISRITVGLEDIHRTPRVLYTEWWPKPMAPKFEAIDLPHLPVEEVFHLDMAQAAKADKAIAEEFVESIERTRLGVVSVDDVMQQIKDREDVAPEVKDAAIKALEAVS
jgi:DNA repair exonuclease SbcCD nuclease subunit